MRLHAFIRISVISALMIIPTIHLSAQTQQRDNRPRTASISGRVTVGGRPAANAKVGVDEVKDLARLGTADFSLAFGGMGAGEDYNALTDADGRFRVISLPEGNYELRVMLKAYVAEKNSGHDDLTRSISLGEGEALENVDFSLVRGGVITGRVTDAGGRPMISKHVQLQIVNEQGQKQPYHGGASSQMYETDDRGVYRIYGLRAGHYLASAGGDGGFEFERSSGGKYPRTWHPETDDENQAKVIEVKEGGESSGVDIKFGVAKRAYVALGRVIDDATGQAIPKVNVICIKTGGDSAGFGGFGGQATTDAQGNFRFSGLAPGRYEVTMMNMAAFLTGSENKHYSEQTGFEVKAGDVADIEIRAKLGATISGVAVIEGANDASVKAMLAQTIIIVVPKPERPDDPVSAQAFDFGPGGMPAMIKGDGGFHLAGIRPGRITLNAANITGKGLLLVRVERNGVDVSDGFEIKAGENVTGVRVVLGHGTGVIRGQVNITGGQLAEGWRIHAFVSSEKSGGEHSGFAQVDGKGRFVIEGLLPGEYTLTLQTNPPPPPPGVNPVQQFESPSPVTQRVVVASGAEVQVTLTLDLKKKDQEERQ